MCMRKVRIGDVPDDRNYLLGIETTTMLSRAAVLF
jgi:hypothetical protein